MAADAMAPGGNGHRRPPAPAPPTSRIPVNPPARPRPPARVSSTQLLPRPPLQPFGVPRPVVEPRRITRIADRVPLASVYLLVVTLVLFQRFVVPGTEVSVALPVAFVVLIGLAARRQLVADVSRLALYLAAVAVCLIVTVAASSGAGPEPSISSLLLLVVLYIPLCFRTSAALREQFPRVLEFFQKLMAVTAAGCLLQFAIQLAGLPYEDLFTAVLPPQLIVADFNTTYPIFYGAPILKANGFVFLEPSFASQFLALAIIIQLMLGHGWRRIALFGLALVTTVSGTGIALLGVGLVVLAYRRGGQWTVRAVLATLFVIVAVSLTPLGEVLAERTGESAVEGSSGNARFVAPYTSVADAISRDQTAFLIGRGAGSVDVDKTFFNPQGLLVNYPALPKLAGEYGVPAALVFLAFVLTVFLRNVPSPTLGWMGIAFYFVLSGSLLQPQTVYVVWLLTGLFAAGRAGEVAGRRVRLSAAAAPAERPVAPGRGGSTPGSGPPRPGPPPAERGMATTMIRLPGRRS